MNKRDLLKSFIKESLAARRLAEMKLGVANRTSFEVAPQGEDPDMDGDVHYIGVKTGEEEEACPECGAPLGMPCEPGCPNAEEAGPDPDRYRE